MSQGLHFDTIIGTTFGLIGIATIVSTLFIGMVADRFIAAQKLLGILRSEEHTSELQSLMRISYAVFCLKNKITTPQPPPHPYHRNITHDHPPPPPPQSPSHRPYATHQHTPATTTTST